MIESRVPINTGSREISIQAGSGAATIRFNSGTTLQEIGLRGAMIN
jgi:hypothetical protein